MSAPACPDCGAEMQRIRGAWRCPWTSTEKWDRHNRAANGKLDQPKFSGFVVSCGWPLTEPREIAGQPNEGVTL